MTDHKKDPTMNKPALTANQQEVLDFVNQYAGTGQEAIVALAALRNKSRASIYASLRATKNKGYGVRDDLALGRKDSSEEPIPDGVPIAQNLMSSDDPVVSGFAGDALNRLREIELALPSAKDGVRALRDEQRKITNALMVFNGA